MSPAAGRDPHACPGGFRGAAPPPAPRRPLYFRPQGIFGAGGPRPGTGTPDALGGSARGQRVPAAPHRPLLNHGPGRDGPRAWGGAADPPAGPVRLCLTRDGTDGGCGAAVRGGVRPTGTERGVPVRPDGWGSHSVPGEPGHVVLQEAGGEGRLSGPFPLGGVPWVSPSFPKVPGVPSCLGGGQLWDVLWVPSCPTLWGSRPARMFCFRLIGIPSYPNESGGPVLPWGSHPPWEAGGAPGVPSFSKVLGVPSFWGGPILPQQGILGSHPCRGRRESPPAPKASLPHPAGGIPSFPRDLGIPTLPWERGGAVGVPSLPDPRAPRHVPPAPCGREVEGASERRDYGIAWLCPGHCGVTAHGIPMRGTRAVRCGVPGISCGATAHPARRGVGRGRGKGLRATPQPVPTSGVPRWGSYREGPASLPPPPPPRRCDAGG